jgi:hypothetical protein
LTLKNIESYLPNQKEIIYNDKIKVQAKSDIIRVNILNNYGGVWVDATLLCFQPLDSYLTSEMLKSGIWMYHGHGADMCGLHGPSSWFIITIKNSYIIDKWAKECNSYIQNNYSDYPYFWMDECFKKLYKTDKKFYSLWNSTPFLYADAFGQSHSLCYSGGMFGYSESLIRKLTTQPPYVLKMWSYWDDYKNNTVKTNGDYSIQIALTNKIIFRHDFKFIRFNLRMLVPWNKRINFLNKIFNKLLLIWSSLRY